MMNQHPRGRPKPSRRETESLARFFEPLQKDPAGQSDIQRHLDALDGVAAEMEAVWGMGRLIPLVDGEMRAKFFKQMAKLNAAIEKNDPEAVETHATALARGWRALDQAARQAGHQPKPYSGTEVRLKDGRMVAIVPEGEVPQYRQDGAEVITITEAEIGLILSDLLCGDSTLAAVLKSFPAARLTALQRKPKADWAKGDDVPF